MIFADKLYKYLLNLYSNNSNYIDNPKDDTIIVNTYSAHIEESEDKRILINRFDLLDALNYANSTENCQMFLKLEVIYSDMKNQNNDYIFVCDEEILDYINNVNLLRYENKKIKQRKKTLDL